MGVGPDQLAGRNVQATSVMANSEPVVLGRLATELSNGKLRAPIQRTYPLEQTGQTMADFAAGTRGKLAISIE
jgi:NADPH:quinone reductase